MKFLIFAASLPFLAIDGEHVKGFALLGGAIVCAYVEPYIYAGVKIIAKAVWLDP